MENKEFYRRNLPHIQPIGGTFFVTFNLAGSLPKPFLEKLQTDYELLKQSTLQSPEAEMELQKLRKKYFKEQDGVLDNTEEGLHHLKDDRIAEIVAHTLHHSDGQKLELICYCIMSNHVHVVLRLFAEKETDRTVYLHKVLQSIKGFSARKANQILQRQGQFWQHESFDYLVKDREELYRIIQYSLNNPVKAGLCANRQDWKWSYIKSEYNEFI